LGGEVLGLVELEILRGGFLIRDLDRLGRVELIADRAYIQCVWSGREPVRRETEAAIAAGDDGHSDVRTGFGGADQHALHRRFRGRTDEAGERRGRRLGRSCPR
jgi:hypothetical protein